MSAVVAYEHAITVEGQRMPRLSYDANHEATWGVAGEEHGGTCDSLALVYAAAPAAQGVLRDGFVVYHMTNPGETPARSVVQWDEGSLPVKGRHVFLTAAPAVVADEAMVLMPRDEIERVIMALRYAAHPQPSPHADALAAALGQKVVR